MDGNVSQKAKSELAGLSLRIRCQDSAARPLPRGRHQRRLAPVSRSRNVFAGNPGDEVADYRRCVVGRQAFPPGAPFEMKRNRRPLPISPDQRRKGSGRRVWDQSASPQSSPPTYPRHSLLKGQSPSVARRHRPTLHGQLWGYGAGP